MVIGLTGGVGSGKTTIAGILHDYYGAELILSDEVARQLMEPGHFVYDKVIEEFGNDIVAKDNTIDRKKLAAIVFGDKQKIKTLNEITHPATINEIKERIKSFMDRKAALIVVESAMLVQTGCDKFCDTVWTVVTNHNTRQKRLESDRGYTKQKTQSVMKNQQDDEWYIKNSDVQIYNDMDIDNLKKQIDKILNTD